MNWNLFLTIMIYYLEIAEISEKWKWSIGLKLLPDRSWLCFKNSGETETEKATHIAQLDLPKNRLAYVGVGREHTHKWHDTDAIKS